MRPQHLPPLVDTHAHAFRRGLELSTTRRYAPDYDATVEDYLLELDANGIDRGVLIQPSFLGSDNSYLLDCLAQNPARLRGVVVVDPEQELDFDQLHEQGVRGVRLNLIGAEVPELERPSWQGFGRRIEQLGWHLEVQARGGQWADLAPRLASWPSHVVVDHLGLPSAGDSRATDLVDNIGRLAHVSTKVSAPYRSEDADAAVRRYLETRGTENLLFGTDWPFTKHEDGRRMSSQVSWAKDLLGDDAFADALPRNAQGLFAWS
ncbi:amidohydrolase family protein [Rhodococcoides yunnanense]|uniref:Amidohydrolase family protein n=1 Tax=Rhodococcoides yunnanense TaxID=278209 RepID=A0ABU4B7T8_9NOCA|nr:amidohydrolase family protein [Rhodococcus yunnanensis]MDV6260248.1 amidohydrolase family protein [Rhodococcus yunnanensis]